MKEIVYKHNDGYYYDILRNNIRSTREEKKLTQQDIADMTGLSRQYICDIENKTRDKRPTIATAGLIADAMNIELSELFKTNKDK